METSFPSSIRVSIDTDCLSIVTTTCPRNLSRDGYLFITSSTRSPAVAPSLSSYSISDVPNACLNDANSLSLNFNLYHSPFCYLILIS